MKTQTENPVVIFSGYYSGFYLSHTGTCRFEETLSCKVYTFQFASVVFILHAFPWRSLYHSLTRNLFCCTINLKASIFPPLGNHLTNASTKPPRTSIPAHRCINSLESRLGEISSLGKLCCLFTSRYPKLKDVDFPKSQASGRDIRDEDVDKSLS